MKIGEPCLLVCPGAPYYAAHASLRFGGDLSFVFCAAEALVPIKSYSPELMVAAFYDAKEVESLAAAPLLSAAVVQCKARAVKVIADSFARIHSLVVGPGLGRNQMVLDIVSSALAIAVERKLPVVIDADGLFMIAQNLNIIRNCTRCILTPNKVEFDRLVQAALAELADGVSGEYHESDEVKILVDHLASDDDHRKIYALSKSLGGVTVLRKGREDLICGGTEDVYVVTAEGSPRRCGGQGDVLAGSLGTAIYWSLSAPPAGILTRNTNILEGLDLIDALRYPVFCTDAARTIELEEPVEVRSFTLSVPPSPRSPSRTSAVGASDNLLQSPLSPSSNAISAAVTVGAGLGFATPTAPASLILNPLEARAPSATVYAKTPSLVTGGPRPRQISLVTYPSINCSINYRSEKNQGEHQGNRNTGQVL
jgi:hydroxyethylthiazole kinase-like uncharacterized protein yjeF